MNHEWSSEWFTPSLHRPKSAILTKPSASISRLSSFKSLRHKQTLPVWSWRRRGKAVCVVCNCSGFSPVNYFVLMEELQAEQHTWRVEPESKKVEILTEFGDALKVTRENRTKSVLLTVSVYGWRCCCGYGSLGLPQVSRPWRSKRGGPSGSSRAGGPGKDVAMCWSPQRSSSHTPGCITNTHNLPVNPS